MPWRQMPMKDVVHCEMPRGVVCERYIRGCPNGETHQGLMPWYCHLNKIGWQGERGELKHLSNLRKRNDSQSSGERNGSSPNHSYMLVGL